ncbi:MAG: response regulator [Candidatus Omnitrophota bacterium]
MARILVCDDSPFMRVTIREMLEKGGHDVVAEATDGVEAVKLYAEHRPDLVTMDILMKTSGTNAIKDIIKMDPDAVIVVVTVLSEQEAEIVESIRSGARGIVTKPIRIASLLSEVNRVLGSHSETDSVMEA